MLSQVLSTISALGSKHWSQDFPCGPVVKNLPSNAGNEGSIPGWETKIPHAVELLSLLNTTREPRCSNYWSAPEPVLHNREAQASQLEKTCALNDDPAKSKKYTEVLE